VIIWQSDDWVAKTKTFVFFTCMQGVPRDVRISIFSLFRVTLHFCSVLVKTVKITSLGNSKMWFTIFAPSRLTEILRNLSRFLFIKQQRNIKYLHKFYRYKEGRPLFKMLRRRSVFLLTHSLTFSHQSNTILKWSRMPMFIGTPCTVHKPSGHLLENVR